MIFSGSTSFSAALRRFRGRFRHRPALAAVLLEAVALAAVSLVVAGCGHESARPGSYAFAELEGKLVDDEPFLVVPNRAWRRQDDNSAWFFGHSAALICHVRETPAEPIVFGFVPAEPGRGAELEFLWNGRDVSQRRRRYGTSELQIEVPAAWLTPGTHFLTLRNAAAGEGPESYPLFHHIGYRFGGTPHMLEAREFLTYRYLSSLLTFGLTGSFSSETLGGFVWMGPRRHELDLGTEAGGFLQTRLQNASAGRAVFRVRWPGAEHELELEPHERRHLSLSVPPGVRTAELSVEGDPNGFFHWGAPHFQPADAPRVPPVVLVTLDTTRRDVVGAYGGGRATPHLDAFAAQATLYTNANTTAPWTLPAHASIFTGLYPSRHGAGVAGDHLEIGFTTLAELLRDRGYLTAGFTGGLLSSSRFGVGQGFALYRNVERFETAADRLTEHALAFLEQSAEPTGAPFFLFVNYFDPHFPYAAPRRFQDAFGLAERRRALGHDPAWQQVLDGSATAWERVVDREVTATPAARGALEAAYRAEVAFMDEQLGRLFDRLRERGLFDDALVIVTADHGELLGEGGYFSHSGRLDPELVEIPLIVKWPRQRSGKREERLVSLVDLFPTILRAAGLEPSTRPIDGMALQLPPGEREFVIAEEHHTDFHPLPAGMTMAADVFAALGQLERQVSWNGGAICHRRENGGWRPDSCQSSRLAEAGSELRRQLERDAYRPLSDRIGQSRREREQLRALGYLR